MLKPSLHIGGLYEFAHFYGYNNVSVLRGMIITIDDVYLETSNRLIYHLMSPWTTYNVRHTIWESERNKFNFGLGRGYCAVREMFGLEAEIFLCTFNRDDGNGSNNRQYFFDHRNEYLQTLEFVPESSVVIYDGTNKHLL